MTLKQAYENWAGDNENKILATKSLSATKKCFLEKYGNTPLKEVTRDFALNIFTTCKEMKELRVKAAAVFVYVMKWAREKALDIDCPVCDYQFTDLTSAEVRPKAQPKKAQEKGKEVRDLPAEKKQTHQTVKPRSKKDGREVVIILNPETMELGQRFPSISQAFRDLHVVNIDRYCKSHRPHNGTYFAFVDELDGWKPAQAKVTNDGKERGGSRVSQEVLYVDASHPSEYVRYQSVYQAEKDLHVRNIAKKTDNMVILNGHYFMTPDYYEKFMEMYSQEQRTDIPLKTDEAPEEKNILLPESEQMQDLPEEVFSIETVTDGDLIDELRRRGWTGDVYVHVRL